MGCGQSKIHLYPRKSKSKTNGKKSMDMVDPDAEEDDEGHKEAVEKELNGHGKGLQYHLRNEEDDNNGLLQETEGKCTDESGINGEMTIPMMRGKNLSLLTSQDILSSSQHNFFKMLDQKIEEGPDYDSTSETEIALEEARLNALVQHWESASLTASLCSSASRSLQSTPIRNNNPPPIRMMSPKRDQRVLPQANIVQQQQQQAYGQKLPPHQQQQQLPQYQYQSQVLPGPSTYLPQPYAASAGNGPGMMRVGPRMLPIGVPVAATAAVPSNGVISTVMPPSAATVRIPVGYYSQHPSMVAVGPQMAYPAAAAGGGVPIPQPNPNTPASSYYGDLLQHPLQAPQQQQPQPASQMNPMMTYNPLMGVVMDGSGSLVENKVFPAAISVQRLAPQVQRQLRETQELIKDSCQGLVYGSPGPPPQQAKMMLQPGPSPPTGPPPPPQRTSTLRKNVLVGVAASSASTANNNTSFESHPQDYS